MPHTSSASLLPTRTTALSAVQGTKVIAYVTAGSLLCALGVLTQIVPMKQTPWLSPKILKAVRITACSLAAAAFVAALVSYRGKSKPPEPTNSSPEHGQPETTSRSRDVEPSLQQEPPIILTKAPVPQAGPTNATQPETTDTPAWCAKFRIARTNCAASDIEGALNEAKIICIGEYHFPDDDMLIKRLYAAINRFGDHILYEGGPIRVRANDTAPEQTRWDEDYADSDERETYVHVARELSRGYLDQLAKPEAERDIVALKNEIRTWIDNTRDELKKCAEIMIDWSATRTHFLRDHVIENLPRIESGSLQRLIVTSGFYHLGIVEGFGSDSHWSLIRPPSYGSQINAINDLWESLDKSGFPYVIVERKFSTETFFATAHPVFRYLDKIIKQDRIDLPVVVQRMNELVSNADLRMPYEKLMMAKFQVELLARYIQLQDRATIS